MSSTKQTTRWTKDGKRFYSAKYVTNKYDRVFTLIPVKGSAKVLSFESWQAAKKAGFFKVS
jgi:hypothetical protein